MVKGYAQLEATKEYLRKYGWIERVTQNDTLFLTSPIGLGNHLGTFSEEDSEAYINAMIYAMKNGINVIDTAINYRGMKSEKDTGCALKKAIELGIIKREEIVISTKAGLLFGDITKGIKPSDYLEKVLVEKEITIDDFSRYHVLYQTLKTDFFDVALQISMENLGVETIDIHYIHIPEISHAGLEEEEFYHQLSLLFKWYETMVQVGKIRYYGLAFEMLSMEPDEMKWYISLERVVAIANKVSEGNSHLKFIQLPYNQIYDYAFTKKNQTIGGKADTILCVAHKLGLHVVGSMPFSMGAGFEKTSLRNMIEFALKPKEIDYINCGSKNIIHIQEIIDVARALR